MRELDREDIVGRRNTEVIISLPDKPITMSAMSYSAGYLRLDSKVLVPIGHNPAQPIRACDEAALRDLARDSKYEMEFRPVIQQKITDVLA